MARSLASRLDRLERLAEQVLNQHQGPVYLRDGDPERLITIRRIYLDPPEQPQERLPELVEASPAIERAAPPSFTRKLAEPEMGIV